MRLTKEDREDFVTAVMKNIPMKSDMTESKLTEEVTRRLNATHPQEVRDFAKKYPKVVMLNTKYLDFAAYSRKDPYRPGKMSRVYIYANGVIGDAQISDIDVKDLEEKWKEYLEELTEREEMFTRLTDVAKACTTHEALAAALPELVDFIPEPVKKVKNLPVAQADLVKDLKSMGLKVKKARNAATAASQ